MKVYAYRFLFLSFWLLLLLWKHELHSWWADFQIVKLTFQMYNNMEHILILVNSAVIKDWIFSVF